YDTPIPNFRPSDYSERGTLVHGTVRNCIQGIHAAGKALSLTHVTRPNRARRPRKTGPLGRYSSHTTATFMTPSVLFSKIRYASSIRLNGNRCVMSGVVSSR